MRKDDDTTPTGSNDTRSRNIRTLLSVLMERYSNYEVDVDAGSEQTTRFYVRQDGARLFCDVSNEALASKELTREQTEVADPQLLDGAERLSEDHHSSLVLVIRRWLGRRS